MVERGGIYYVTTIYVNFLDGVKYRRKISDFVAFLELNNGIINLYRRKKN